MGPGRYLFDRIHRMDRIPGGESSHTETRRQGGETEETRSEEMARRHLLRPVGGFPPEDREGWGLG